MKNKMRIALAIAASLLCYGTSYEALAQCSPQQLAKVTASDAVQFDDFGQSVAISGNTAIVGNPYHSSYDGSAYVYVGNGVTWTQQAKLVAPDPGGGDEFGLAVAISGDTAVVGAPYNNNG